MMKSGSIVVLGSAVVVMFAGVAFGEPDAALLVGTKSCKMCHKKDDKGNQYAKWQAAGHSKAQANLASPEAKAVAKKLGIADPQTSGKCLKCHSTAYNGTEEVKAAKVAVEDGVSCESCHGPGKNYKKKATMKDKAKSIAAGLVSPATKNCAKCHNDTSPTWKADRYTTKDGKKVGFDVDQAYEKIKHPNPQAK
jgi:hypothetical protein